MIWNVGLPYPLDNREYVATSGTALLLQGKDPYGMDQQPSFLYAYGFVQSLVAYPFAEIFGPTLQLHRAISCISIILCSLTLFWALRTSGISTALAWTGALLLLNHLAYAWPINAKPDALGLLFFLLSVVIPYWGEFCWWSLLASIFLTIVAFYTKPYYVLGAPFLATYLFIFRTKEVGIKVGVIFLVLLALSVIGVNRVSPLYFSCTFFCNLNLASKASLGHLVETLLRYCPLGLGMFVALAWEAIQNSVNLSLRKWLPCWNLFEIRKPLWTSPNLEWPTFLLISSTIVYLGRMGTHLGNGINYIFELVLPFLIWRAFITIGIRLPNRMSLLIFLQLTVVVVAVAVTPRIYSVMRYAGDEARSWNHASELLSNYHDVFSDIVFASIDAQQGKEIYDCGLAEYWKCCIPHNPSRYIKTYEKRCQERVDEITWKIRTKQFDAILLGVDGSPLLPNGLVPQYYYKVETFRLWTTFQQFDIVLWRPIP